MVDFKVLISHAMKARERAYAPYSHFRVGAALITKEGKIYEGCNIESASYSLCNCAERTAIFKAVSEGERDFEAIAVVGAPEGQKITEICTPCGSCRQVMMEFAEPKEFKIVLPKNAEEYDVYTLDELLPLGFKLDI